MTFQEKKQAIIDQIKNETSEIIIDRMASDYKNIKSWDSEYGQEILRKLLEKSQQEALDGKTRSYEEFRTQLSERFFSRVS